MNEELTKWNRLIKRQDEIYHQCAKRAKLPDAQFWVLYVLCAAKHPLCQNTFCENWCYSKQTIHTAVTGLEKAGLIHLTFAEGSRKKKDLHLTEKGEEFCDQHIRSVLNTECKILNQFPANDREAFFQFFKEMLNGIEEELIKNEKE